MTDVQERRDLGTQRVAVSTLVEICGNRPGTSVFEAEAIDVSPRGMHLRTAYLPEIGTPLVCRFEKDGGEIVVEGLVAWRREGGRGGEFGVQFTALDSRSVDSLRELCAGGEKPDEPYGALAEPGARVRLHIDGLGSPMKARIRAGKPGKVQVGSSLEFLKVGRRLEIEDLEQGARRAAQIDGVSVTIDPSTQVPQLVVALRYEGGEDTTPSPVTAETAQATPRVPRPRPRSAQIPAAQVTLSVSPSPQTPSEKDSKPAKPRETEPSKTPAQDPISQSSEEDDELMLRGRFGRFANRAEAQVKSAGERLASASATTLRGTARWIELATRRVISLNRQPSSAPRRTTSPAPASSLSSDKPKLRAQTGSASPRSENPATTRRRLSRVAVATGAVAVVGIATASIVSRSPTGSPPGAIAANATSAVATTGAAPEPNSATTPRPALPSSSRDRTRAITANVPLFGPTPLTTTEPAPLGPPPGAQSEEALEMQEANTALRAVTATDQHWSDEKPQRNLDRQPQRAEERAQNDSEKPAVRPEDVPAWGRGRMSLPTIHRLRLDAPGGAMKGVADATGFTVVIPGRKVMEAAGGIAKRDERIARARADNIGAGAQVSFRFKDGVPSYRVRLRRDYIELLLSAPDKKKSDKATRTEKSR